MTETNDDTIHRVTEREYDQLVTLRDCLFAEAQRLNGDAGVMGLYDRLRIWLDENERNQTDDGPEPGAAAEQA